MTRILVQKLSARWAPALYFILGQAGWFACVLGASSGKAYLGIALVIVLVVAHLLRATRAAPEIKLIAAVLIIGGSWESALLFLGLLSYPTSGDTHGIAPLWLLALWGLFAAQFNTTYRWLKKRLLIGALLGAFAGPLSFRAGAALGALQFVKPLPATVALAIGWACLLPLIIILSRRWDGVD